MRYISIVAVIDLASVMQSGGHRHGMPGNRIGYKISLT